MGPKRFTYEREDADIEKKQIGHFIIGFFLSTAVTWRDQDARLTVHYENGFTLTDARNEGNGRSQVLWYFPFEKLKRSADDGQRMLWLEFGADESDQVMKYNVADGSCFSHSIINHAFSK